MRTLTNDPAGLHDNLRFFFFKIQVYRLDWTSLKLVLGEPNQTGWS